MKAPAANAVGVFFVGGTPRRRFPPSFFNPRHLSNKEPFASANGSFFCSTDDCCSELFSCSTPDPFRRSCRRKIQCLRTSCRTCRSAPRVSRQDPVVPQLSVRCQCCSRCTPAKERPRCVGFLLAMSFRSFTRNCSRSSPIMARRSYWPSSVAGSFVNAVRRSASAWP